MKKEIKKLTEAELRDYPIRDLVDGWYFRQDEISNGVYLVEGIDAWGRKVSQTGSEGKLDELLLKCAEAAKEIIRSASR